ncbi:HEAT repeat domain-containing protein, partial [Planctomycetota bacterium]
KTSVLETGREPWSPPDGKIARLESSAQNRLNSKHTLIRFEAIYRTIKTGAIDDAIAVGLYGHAGARWSLVDYISILLAGKKLDNSDRLTVHELASLRGSTDRNVRVIPAYCGNRLGQKSDYMLEVYTQMLLEDPDLFVRAAAATALSKSERKEAVPFLVLALKQDPAWKVRRAAAIALGSFQNTPATEALIISMQDDPAREVRARAAYALGLNHMPGAERALKKAMYAGYCYTRMFAANSLLTGYNDRAGIKGLIDLRTDHPMGVLRRYYYPNLYGYSNKDFKTPAEWKKWWQQEGSSFDLEGNIKIVKTFEEIDNLNKEEKYAEVETRLREMLKQYPDNQKDITSRLAETLDTLAGKLYKNDPDDLDKALTKARESVKLNPNAWSMDTLAKLLYMKGDTEEAITTMTQALEKVHARSKNDFSRYLQAMINGSYLADEDIN